MVVPLRGCNRSSPRRPILPFAVRLLSRSVPRYFVRLLLYFALILIVALLTITITLDLGFVLWFAARITNLARLSWFLAFAALLKTWFALSGVDLHFL